MVMKDVGCLKGASQRIEGLWVSNRDRGYG